MEKNNKTTEKIIIMRAHINRQDVEWCSPKKGEIAGENHTLSWVNGKFDIQRPTKGVWLDGIERKRIPGFC